MNVQLVITYCSLILNVAAVGALLIKPIREKLFGIKEIREGNKCLLRSNMLTIRRQHVR